MGEGEFQRDVPPRRVCVPCRRVLAGRSASPFTHRQRTFRHMDPRPQKCPECGGPLVSISHRVKVPRRHDIAGWKRMVSTWRDAEQWTATMKAWTR